jgi:Transposase DDE domain
MPEEMTYECRENRFYATTGLYARLRVSPMRRTLQRQLQRKDVLLQRSVPLHDVRATDLPGKPQGHRGLLACGEDKPLSVGHPGQGLRKHYPEKLRRIRYFDAGTKKRLIFLPNNFTLPAPVIAPRYRRRWRVELSFKWIKQHPRINAFHGTTKNALKSQIWIAISVYVLAAIVIRPSARFMSYFAGKPPRSSGCIGYHF